MRKTNCCRCLRWKVFAKWVAAIFLVNNRHSLDASVRYWACGLDFRFSCIKNRTKWDALDRGVLLFQPIWYLSKCRIIQSDGKSTRNAQNSNYQFRQLFERVRKEEQRRTKKKIKKNKTPAIELHIWYPVLAAWCKCFAVTAIRSKLVRMVVKHFMRVSHSIIKLKRNFCLL